MDCPALQAGQPLQEGPSAISGEKYPFCSPTANSQTDPECRLRKGALSLADTTVRPSKLGSKRRTNFPGWETSKGV